MIFLGEASNYIGKVAHHTFSLGFPHHSADLRAYLAGRYDADLKTISLTSNGRSALCLALKSLIPPNSEVVLNAFTCHAILVAIREAHCTPVFADIDEDTLHYSEKTLSSLLKSHKNIKAFIIQNSLGYPVDIRPFETLAKKNNLVMIEDMAHCAGRLYPDGRECGSVGDAACFSFGKGKSIDTITGGALLFHSTPVFPQPSPRRRPRFSANFRARLYPFFGVLLRASFKAKMNKILAGILLKLHLIERSADSPLDLSRRLAHWQSRLALESFEKLKPTKSPLREFVLVDNRDDILDDLRDSGYIFDEFWYEVPISPARYYSYSGFDESACPVATSVSKRILNLPTWYDEKYLKKARKIIKDAAHGN